MKKNKTLFVEGAKRIEDYTLVALTIMIAESKPEEKEMMVNEEAAVVLKWWCRQNDIPYNDNMDNIEAVYRWYYKCDKEYLSENEL